MFRIRTFTRRTLLTAAAALLAAGAVHAYPERAISIVVPYAPGGAADSVARVIATKLGPALGGASVIVDNRAGAGGTIGEAYVAKAKPDGYTLLYTAAPYAINPHLYSKMPYEAKALEPLSLVLLTPNALVVKADSPHQSVQDLVEQIKKTPGKLNYASGGSGTVQRLASELLRQRLDLDLVHVPYRSGGPAITDVIAGQVDFMFGTVAATHPLITGGKLRALAVSSPERSPSLPDVPTVAETVAPDFEVMEWNGLLAPAGLPAEVSEKLQKALAEVLKDPEVQQRLTDMGAQPVGSTPAEFAHFLETESAKWAEVIRKGNITLD